MRPRRFGWLAGVLSLSLSLFALQCGQGGFTRILVQKDGHWVMDGWRHFGPGDFTLDSTTGILETHGGMGLLWYTPRMYADFQLQLDFKVADTTSNSGVFLRVPAEPTSDDYIYHGWRSR